MWIITVTIFLLVGTTSALRCSSNNDCTSKVADSLCYNNQTCVYPVDICRGVNCGKNGRCSSSTGQCVCKSDLYYGERCEFKNCGLYGFSDDSGQCICRKGFTGDLCDTCDTIANRTYVCCKISPSSLDYQLISVESSRVYQYAGGVMGYDCTFPNIKLGVKKDKALTCACDVVPVETEIAVATSTDSPKRKASTITLTQQQQLIEIRRQNIVKYMSDTQTEPLKMGKFLDKQFDYMRTSRATDRADEIATTGAAFFGIIVALVIVTAFATLTWLTWSCMKPKKK